MLRERVWAEHRRRWDFTDDPPGGSLFRVAAASGGSPTACLLIMYLLGSEDNLNWLVENQCSQINNWLLASVTIF